MDAPDLATTPLSARVAILLVSVAVAGTLFLNFCDAIFRCGCRSWWQGAADLCNIQQAGAPDCPWCAAGIAGAVVPFGTIVVAQAVVALGPWPRRAWPRLGAALLAFPLLGGLAGLAFGLVMGYWT